MILIPAENQISKKNPPYLIIALILLNVWVFYFLQSDNGKVFNKALDYYQQSDLLSKEKDVFYDFLLKNDIDTHNQLRRASTYLPDEQLISYIIQREDFSQHIKDLSSYSLEWRNKRQELKTIFEEDFTYKYVFKNYAPTLTDSFVSMFMHASNMHLWGNMLFLLVFGFNLELLLGRGKTLFLYLVSGFAADGLHLITSVSDYGSALGASGAIAGLMGGFCGWYGLKKIRYFYWFFIIFNYIKLPAALVFTFFLAKEYISSVVSDNNVAYMAHFGGLVAGFICAIIFKYLIKSTPEEPDVSIPGNNIAPNTEKYQQANTAFQNLDFERARQLFSQLIESEPQNLDYYTKYFALEKTTPQTNRFSELCGTIILASTKDARFNKLMEQALDELTHHGHGLKSLPSTTLIALARSLIKRSHLQAARPIINFLVKHYDFNEQLPQLLFQYGLACEKNDDWNTYHKVFTYLSKKHGDSFVGEEARKALEQA